jgi:uncharacterized membrane protein YbhN (UPF0104 family)
MPLRALKEIWVVAGTQGLRNEVRLDILDVGVALEFAKEWTIGIYGHHTQRFASTLARMTQVHDVFATLWQRALSATFVALFLHVAFFMSFYCGLRAVGGAAPVLDVLTAMPIVDAAASLPVSVSGLGVRERTFEALLAGIAGVPDAVGISASLAGWLFNLFWGLVGGVLFLLAKQSAASKPEVQAA